MSGPLGAESSAFAASLLSNGFTSYQPGEISLVSANGSGRLGRSSALTGFCRGNPTFASMNAPSGLSRWIDVLLVPGQQQLRSI